PRAPMWVLHAGDADDGARPARARRGSIGRGRAPRDPRKPVPVHGLPVDRDVDPRRGRGDARRGAAELDRGARGAASVIPAPFEYARPASLDEALELVAGADPSIRVLAGGQSLIPLMKLRLARPLRLIDVGRLDGLHGITEAAGGGLRVGAMTT